MATVFTRSALRPMMEMSGMTYRECVRVCEEVEKYRVINEKAGFRKADTDIIHSVSNHMFIIFSQPSTQRFQVEIRTSESKRFLVPIPPSPSQPKQVNPLSVEYLVDKYKIGHSEAQAVIDAYHEANDCWKRGKSMSEEFGRYRRITKRILGNGGVVHGNRSEDMWFGVGETSGYTSF